MDSVYKGFNFANNAENYRRYRPDYPDQLFHYLAMLSDNHENAWDVATGNGQAAIGLAQSFSKVYASDISTRQLENAHQRKNIKYFVGRAEQCKFPDESMDIITVAQALHWFDIDKFFAEAKRILKPGGILAVWNYQLLQINHEVDAVIRHLYENVLKNYWPNQRETLENNFSDYQFPFQTIPTPDFKVEKTWTFDQVIGYLNSWSATQNYIQQEQKNPISQLSQKLIFAWCDTNHMKKVQWPIKLTVCRKPES